MKLKKSERYSNSSPNVPSASLLEISVDCEKTSSNSFSFSVTYLSIQVTSKWSQSLLTERYVRHEALIYWSSCFLRDVTATQLISCLRSDPLLQMICRRVLLEILMLAIIVSRTLTHIQCRCFHLNSSVNFDLCRATSIQRNWSHDVSPKVIISMKPITHVKFVMYSSLNYFAGIIITITPSFIDI